MDDHLFVDLRTALSRLVTVGEIKISCFLHCVFTPTTHLRQLLTWLSGSCSLCLDNRPRHWGRRRPGSPADAGARDECECAMWYLALFSVCDKWLCFLHLADRSISCFKSTHRLYSDSAACLGNCHIQGVSQMRRNTSAPPLFFSPLFLLLKALLCRER